MQPDNLEDDLEDEPEPEPKDYQALLPYPKSEKYWMPEDDPSVLVVQVSESTTEISSSDHLINLVEARLRSLVRMSDDPEGEVGWMLERLDRAGLIDPNLDLESLARAEPGEWQQLFQRDGVRGLMYKAMDSLEFPIPVRGNNPEAQEVFQDETLGEWAGWLVNLLDV